MPLEFLLDINMTQLHTSFIINKQLCLSYQLIWLFYSILPLIVTNNKAIKDACLKDYFYSSP